MLIFLWANISTRREIMRIGISNESSQGETRLAVMFWRLAIAGPNLRNIV